MATFLANKLNTTEGDITGPTVHVNKQSKKVKLCVIQHAATKSNRSYLLCTEITISHLFYNCVCQQRYENKHSDPLFFITFLISPCPVTKHTRFHWKSMAASFRESPKCKKPEANVILLANIERTGAKF